MQTQKSTQCAARVVLRDDAGRRWLDFVSPRRIVSTCRIDDVLPLLREIDEAVERGGKWAAGFIAYEAAPAFDSSLSVRADGVFPLLWFGVFERVREIVLPEDGRGAWEGLEWQPSVSRAAYDRALATIRSRIREGDTYQVNFTYRLRTRHTVDPWALFLRLAGGGEAPFAAFVDTGEWAVCSASPELFLRIDGERIESRPMKGTAARGLWSEDDQARKTALLDSEKERAENVMIVDMVRNDLGRVAEPGRVEVPALRQRPGCSDVLLFNEAGEVTETTVANVAVEIGGVRYTPPVRCGLLPGTHRAVLLERGELRERVILIEELRECPRVFLLNSVRGLHAVSIESERM